MVASEHETLRALRHLTENAGDALNLTEAERAAIAAELYRLADIILSGPTTAQTLGAVHHAQRRAAWLMRWLERAVTPQVRDMDGPDKP
ncbi:MAG: hypothetical protein RIR62_938 [Pseudomonadota bacterium]|jgi:Lon protease-like protein